MVPMRFTVRAVVVTAGAMVVTAGAWVVTAEAMVVTEEAMVLTEEAMAVVMVVVMENSSTAASLSKGSMGRSTEEGNIRSGSDHPACQLDLVFIGICKFWFL
ncbi:hypothetical protein OIU78_010874 [Salix suchowensis]|nr:hypothetical protein OIU78_010874 [Salix suchowensis]